MNKRIFVCELLQESNSFNPVLATYEDFENVGIFEGEALVKGGEKAGNTLHGAMVAMADRGGYEPVGGVRMRAKSGGPVDHKVVDWFLEKTVAGLKAAGPLDGVFVSLHGATQSDVSDDVCGDILTVVRETVGQELVVTASCDLHGNVTERMMKAADHLTGYQTYPHLDHYGVGYRAAVLAMDTIEGKPRRTARVEIPMMAPAHGYSTTRGGLNALMEKGHALVKEGKIVDFSIFQVQPWLDVEKIGSVVLVTAESEEVAKSVAAELAAEEFALRAELQGEKLWDIPSVVQAAIDNQIDKPVILVDSADSPNAGACGDSATVLEYVLPYRDTLRVAFSCNDVDAVAKAYELGVGAKADFTLGASLAPALSKPVEVKDCVIRSLHDGEFILGGPAERGQRRSLGRSAVLQAGQIFILVTERGQNNGDLQFYRGFGIEPTLCRLVDVKACSSFRAGYEPVSALICNSVTPGAAGPELQALPFRKVPAPFYPFQEITADMISAPVCHR